MIKSLYLAHATLVFILVILLCWWSTELRKEVLHCCKCTQLYELFRKCSWICRNTALITKCTHKWVWIAQFSAISSHECNRTAIQICLQLKDSLPSRRGSSQQCPVAKLDVDYHDDRSFTSPENLLHCSVSNPSSHVWILCFAGCFTQSGPQGKVVTFRKCWMADQHLLNDYAIHWYGYPVLDVAVVR